MCIYIYIYIYMYPHPPGSYYQRTTRLRVSPSLCARSAIYLSLSLSLCMCIYIYIHIYIYIYHGISYDIISYYMSCRDLATTLLMPSKQRRASIGWHYLSNATCLMRPHLFYVCVCVALKDHHNLRDIFVSLLEKACV